MHQTISKKKFSIGELYYLNEDEVHFLIHEIFYLQTYLSDFLILNRGSVILDVGANIGIFSLFALQTCHGDALVHGFEPIPATFQCLEKNVAPYRDNICVYNAGVSNVMADCDIDFTLFGNDVATATYRPMDKLISNYQPFLNYKTLLALLSTQKNALYYQLKFLPFMRNYLINKHYKNKTTERKIRCKLTSLGNFIENNQLTHIDFLKIDVEGAEVDVIKSIHPKQFFFIKQLSIEVHNIDNRVAHVASYLKEQGYRIKISRCPFFEKLGMNHHMIYAKRAG